MADFIRPAGIVAALAIVLTLPLQVAAEDARMPPIAEPSAAATGSEVTAGDAFKAGDIAATGFAGSKLTAESLPPGVDPVTKSFIDPDGTVLRIYSLGNLGPSASGQTLNPMVVFQAKARDIGQVFGLAFDNLPADQSAKPGLFAAATSAFGLQVVGADKNGPGLRRLWKGGPGAAFMAGQFGSVPGSGPGTIYKIDRATGEVHVFTNVATNGVVNSGPGIGGIAFDPTSRTLYASDLDTGLIHAFGSDGTDIAQFDHGVDGRPLGKKGAVGDSGKRADITSSEFAASNPTTWGFTQTERRIDALAIHDGRLYYAAADGPEIWSIAITSGKFGKDPRFELAVAAAKGFPITAIVFDQAGRMIIGQRGALESPSDYSQFTIKGPAQTLRYAPENPDDPNTPEHWKPVFDEYAVGNIEDFRATSGGLALQYAYKDDGSIDPTTCGGTIIVSGDTLGAARNTTGLQLGKISLVRPANTPPVQTGVIELDPGQNDPAARGHAGGIAVLQDCAGAGGFPPVAGGTPGGDFPAVAGDNQGGGFPPVAGGDAGAGDFPPVADTQEGGGGKTDDGTQEGGGGKTTNGALTMTKSPGSTTCSENQSCSYKITITNGSGQPVPGPVVISDVLSVGGAPFQKAKLDPPPAPWTCVGSAAPGIQCTHPGPVDPNVPLDLTLGFTPEPGSLAGATELKNCVSFPGAPAAQGNGAQQLLPPPPAPTSTSNGGLKVETLGTSPSCSPVAGNCEFEIKITNNTGQPIKDQPLKIFDTLAVGTQSQAKNEAKAIQTPEGLQCKPQGREFNCSQELKSLAPNESITLKVAFSVDTTEGGQANFVQNKTNVTFGPLTGEATAAVAFTDDAKLPEPGADGQPAQGAGGAAAPACASIPVAPSGPIVVNKKGPAKCPLKGPCAFTIDITNSSTTPVPGPIEIVDTIDLPNTTIAGGVAAPFSCDPGGPPFKCRFNGTLQPKETKTLSLTLNIDATAGTKSLKNCAVPTQPQAAAPGQGQEQKQLAPGKKSDLFPFVRKPLFDFATFRPQSFGSSTELFHLVGGAGGNIGGVGPNNCLKWGMDRGGFNVTQSNGPQVGFGNLKVGPDGRTTGEASFIADDGPVTGKVEGTIIGSHVDLTVTWNRGVKKGHYVGEISPAGDFSGTNTASNGVKASFKTNRVWFQCAVDQLCQNYANDAVAAATEFGSLHCGAGGPGRFSTNADEHIKWCMAQTRGGNSPIPVEAEARKTELDSCRAFDARCTKVGLAIAASNDEMKALNCKDAIPSLQPDKAKAACKAAAIKFTPESLAESAKQKLAACKLAKLNGDGGAGGAADPGGAGGAGDPGGAADPGNGGAGNAQQQPANQCVTVELEDKNAPEQKPAGTLAISKNPASGKCTATGGGCDFVVTVFNPDPAVEFNGPVSFTDHISQPDGTAFPNVTVQTPINPQADPGISGGNLVCRKDGNDVNCTSLGASLKIPPGKKIVVPLSFTPGGDTVAKAVKNCASLPGGEPQCVTIPFSENGPLLRAKKFAVGKPETCVPNCEFVIQLSNVGNGVAEGPFVLTDVFKAVNGFDSFKMIGDSKFSCGNTNGSLGCISTNGGTNKLSPGETISGFIVFNVNSVSPEYNNCISYDPAAQRKPSPFDPEAGPLCATIKDTAHGGPNLLVQLTAPNEGADGVGECAINSPCRFSVFVRSNGAVDFPERARFAATVSPNVPQTLRSPPGDGRWICSPNANGKIECSDGAQSKLLAVGNQLPGEIEVVAGPGWQKNEILTLCTEIRPANLASDTNPADNLACKSVKLDPFNVKVQKTGDQSCAPGGDCHFTINLFNPGPIDHNAPVTITDQLKGLSSARIVSITPPLPCASQPTQIPFSCTSPGAVCLDFGAKAGDKCGPRTFEMVVRLPNDQSATQFSNCASATDGQKNRSDDESCATVSLKPVATTVPPPPETLPAVVTPPRECFGGMVMMGGLCQCPPGTRFNGRRCLSDDGDGGAYPVRPDTVTIPSPPPECPSFRPIGTYPNCCPIGTVFRFGACRKPQRIEGPPPSRAMCPSYRPVGTYPDCCPTGMEFRFGACRKRPTHDEPPPPPKCPSYRPIGTPPNCCPIGMEFRFGACRRPIGSGGSDGNIPNGSKPPPPKCPSYRPIGTFPNCCPVGMEFRFGACRRPQHKDDTGTGNGGTNGTQSKDGDRKCPPGYHRLRRPNKYGAYCEQDKQQGPPTCPANRPNGTPPNCCPSGTRFRLGQCYPEKCSPGWLGVPPRCRKPQTNPTPTGPTPTPVPQKPKCSGDKVPSTSGQCVCPNGTTDVGHNQCGDRVR